MRKPALKSSNAPRRKPLRATVPDTSALDQSLGYSLRRAQFSTYSEYSRFMEKFDIRPSQFALLVLLRSNPGLTQSTVAGALSIQKANLVSLLDTLTSRNLVERKPVPGDRRASALHLTREGEAFTRTIEVSHAQLEAELRQRIGDTGSGRLLTLLHDFTVKAG